MLKKTDSPVRASLRDLISATFGRLEIIKPLQVRDFALFWFAMTVSLLGDGIYFVAIAWQVLAIDNSTLSLSLVGFVWMAPQVLFILFGGVIADRYPRRAVLITSDCVRFIALAAISILSITGQLSLWHILVAVILYGIGEAIFGPAFGAIVPELVPQHLLVQANALDQVLRPLAQRAIGPALGGLIVGLAGAGAAFAIDAGTFAISALALWAIRTRLKPSASDESVLRHVVEGYRFVKSKVWLWVTLVSAGIFLFFYWGPVEVLIPFLVKNEIGHSAQDFGIVIACGGVGAIICAVLIAQIGMPKRSVLWMYLFWGVGAVIMVTFLVIERTWQAALVLFISEGMFAAGLVIWSTLLHKHVPAHLLGRVTSFDWFVSTSLIPISFVAVSPFSQLIGARNALVIGTVASGVITLATLLVPGVLALDRAAVKQKAR